MKKKRGEEKKKRKEKKKKKKKKKRKGKESMELVWKVWFCMESVVFWTLIWISMVFLWMIGYSISRV